MHFIPKKLTQTQCHRFHTKHFKTLRRIQALRRCIAPHHGQLHQAHLPSACLIQNRLHQLRTNACPRHVGGTYMPNNVALCASFSRAPTLNLTTTTAAPLVRKCWIKTHRDGAHTPPTSKHGSPRHAPDSISGWLFDSFSLHKKKGSKPSLFLFVNLYVQFARWLPPQTSRLWADRPPPLLNAQGTARRSIAS